MKAAKEERIFATTKKKGLNILCLTAARLLEQCATLMGAGAWQLSV